MIYLGLDNEEKNQVIADYCAAHEIEKVFVLSPTKFKFDCVFENTEHIEWAEIIQYKFFYRLLQEIGSRTLVIVNECLRMQNRYDLTYNCIRHFLNQTNHQLIFQYLPIIDSLDDFMILFDFDTRSRFKREKFRGDLIKESVIKANTKDINFSRLPVDTSNKLKAQYQQEKEKLIANIGLKDPHTIPRNLYLMSGKAKLSVVENHNGFASLSNNEKSYYIGRNNRFKIKTLQTYKESSYEHAPYTVYEFCHNFIDFIDFISLSKQHDFLVLTADLKVDDWYFNRYREWSERLKNAYANILK